MAKAHEIGKKIYEIKQELAKIAKDKHAIEMRVNQLNEMLWRLEGEMEEEQDQHEYKHT